MKRFFLPVIMAAVSAAAFSVADGLQGTSSRVSNNSSSGYYVGGGLGALRAQSFKEVTSVYAKSGPRGTPSLHLYNLFAGYKFNKYFSTHKI